MDTTAVTDTLDLEEQRQSMNELVGLPTAKLSSGPDDDIPFDDTGDASFEHTERRFWERPSSHIAFIGAAGLLAVLLVLSVYNSITGGQGTSTAKTDTPAKKNDFFAAVPSDGTGDWKTQAALAEQKAAFQNRPKTVTPPKDTRVVKPVLPQRNPVPTYIPRPLPVVTRATPATYTPPPISTPPAPTFAAPTVSIPAAPPAPPPSLDEAQKKWESLGKIASWGADDNQTGGQAGRSYTPAVATQTTPPTAQFVSNPVAQAPTPIPAEESAILTGVAPKSVQIGTRVPGKLETPVVYQPPAQGAAPNDSRFVVSLKKPLLATDGSVVLPEGTQLIAQIDAVGSGGLMQLSAISASSPTGDIQLPKGAIQIRGNQGKPLIAKDMTHKGNGFLKNLALFALGGISRGAQLFNQADQSIVSTGTSTIITNQYPQPNYLAGVLEGGTQSVIPNLQQSLQNNSASTSGPLWAIAADTSVEIFVNQSFSI